MHTLFLTNLQNQSREAREPRIASINYEVVFDGNFQYCHLTTLVKP